MTVQSFETGNLKQLRKTLGKPANIRLAQLVAAGLQVVVWTFRPENAFLAADFRNGDGPNARNEAGSIAEMWRYLETGIDGLFSDDTALARAAIKA